MSEIAAASRDALNDLRRSIATYDDVHDLLDEEEFDCLSFETIGWNSEIARPSYAYWRAYYEARIINLAREVSLRADTPTG